MKLPNIKHAKLNVFIILIIVSSKSIACDYMFEVNNAAELNQLNSDLILSIIKAESNYNCKAVSPKGAKGLMQLMDSTSKKYRVINPFDAKENVSAGSQLISMLIRKYNSIDVALAAYNAGEGAVSKYNGIPPYDETVQYIRFIKLDFLKKTGLELTMETALKEKIKSNSPWSRFAAVSPWKKHAL